MKKITLVLCFFQLYFSEQCFAQKQGQNLIDSLKKVLQTQKEDTNKIKTLKILGQNYYMTGNSDSVIKYANQALILSKKINFRKGTGSIYSLLAAGYEKNLPQNLKYTYAALKAYKEIGDKRGIAESFHSLGIIYTDKANFTDAIKNLKIALRMYKEGHDEISIAQCYICLADIYILQKKYKKALEMSESALKIFQKPKMPVWGIALTSTINSNVYKVMGDSLKKIGNNEMAKEMYLNALNNQMVALKIYQDADMTSSIALTYIGLANISIGLVKDTDARQYLKKSVETAKGLNEKQLQFELYKSYSSLDSLNKDYKQAYEHYKLRIAYRDSLDNDESKTKFTQTEMQYEFDKKELAAIALQEKKDIESKRVRNLQYTFISGILLLSVFLYWNNREKQKAKTKIEKAYIDLKAAQSQLIQSEKMASLGELTAGIAHEIQNPLNFVNNFSDINNELLDELTSDIKSGNLEAALSIAKDIRNNEAKINHHGKRADSIVKGMLQHSRKSTGLKESTDINALCEEYLRLAYHGLRAKDKNFNAKLVTDFDPTLPAINVVPQDIGRVILNLLTNAFYTVNEKIKSKQADYAPEVSITTKNLHDKIEVKVSDNGFGISQEDLHKIFVPFFTTKPSGEGTGLGLSMSYDIISKGHNGQLLVESEENSGTTFTILIPK